MTKWVVHFHPDFESEFDELPVRVQTRLLWTLKNISEAGPRLGRPFVDTLYGSSFPNMKEIRVQIDNAYWRFAFAFDPDRNAVVLVGGNKGGETQDRFYRWLIRLADKRFMDWLE